MTLFVPEILYEDNHLIAVNKPADMLTQGDYSKSTSLFEHVKHYLKTTYQKPGNVYLGLLHRLDKPVSGVILFAKTSKAASRLSQQIREKQTIKIYIAITAPCPAHLETRNTPSMVEHFLVRKKDTTVAYATPVNGSQKSQLRITTLRTTKTYALHLVELITGRKHQIRAQLSSLSLPIVGDKKYGSKTILPVHAIGLHAYSFTFIHPTTKETCTITAPFPEYLTSYATDKELADLVSKVIGLPKTS